MKCSRSTNTRMIPAATGDPEYVKFFEYMRTGRVAMPSYNQISLKNLRIYVIMISIYHVLVSHVLMFLVVLALFHAEEMVGMLVVDMDNQREREEYYELPMHSNGETINQFRFKTASQLAAVTLSTLYACTIAVAVYLLCCLCFLSGTLRYRYQLMVPWLILHAVGATSAFWVVIYYENWITENILNGCTILFWVMLAAGSILDMVFFSLCYRFCLTVQCVQKMTISATVAIPYPGNGKAPYHFRRENMYVGDGGHKHCVTTDNCNPNYVV